MAFFSFSSAEKVTLLAASGSDVPQINEKKVIYKMFFQFNRCPQRFFSYNEPEKKQIVIELYDCHITVKDSIAMAFVPPVQSINVKNATTSMVLSGHKAQIFVHLKEDMLADVQCIHDTLQLQLWKELSPGKNAGKKKGKLPVVSLIIIALCAGIAYTIFHFIVAEVESSPS